MAKKKWETYEDATRGFLEDIGGHLGLTRVEGKQKLAGHHSGRRPEVEAVVYTDDRKRLLVECKRKGKRRVEAGDMEAFAYRILDTESAGGIIVTTIGLQEGAKLVAQAEKITTVILDPTSTDEEYIARIANQLFWKQGDAVELKDAAQVELRNSAGKVIQRADSHNPDLTSKGDVA